MRCPGESSSRGEFYYKVIILNTKFLVLNTQFFAFKTKFLVFDTKFIIFTHLPRKQEGPIMKVQHSCVVVSTILFGCTIDHRCQMIRLVEAAQRCT